MDFQDLIGTEKHYKIILADPPWPYRDKGIRGGTKKHYNSMSLVDLMTLPVYEICEENAFLFLWITNPMLPEGLRVMEAWGFEYVTAAFTWIKVNKGQKLNDYYDPDNIKDFMGIGHYTRSNSESCYLGLRGARKVLNSWRQHRGVRNVIFSHNRKHSQKPAEVRKRISVLLGDLPRIELFAREVVPGWDHWGDQIEKGE